MQVRRTLSNGIFTTSKTAQSQTKLRLTESALEALKRHLERQQGEIRTGSLWLENGLVFSTEIGTPLNRHNLGQRSFKPLLKPMAEYWPDEVQ